MASQKHRDPLNPELWNEYHNALKIYKDTLRRKKEIFQKQKLDELEKALDSDTNSFWKTLKNISDSYDEPSSNPLHIIDHKWLSHFQSLHSKHILGSEQQNILKNLQILEDKKDQNNHLRDPTIEHETLNATKKLKNKKSAYSDKIRNKMIKSNVKILLKVVGY